MKPYDPTFDIIDVTTKVNHEQHMETTQAETTAEKMSRSDNAALAWFARSPRYTYLGLGVEGELHQFTRRKK